MFRHFWGPDEDGKHRLWDEITVGDDHVITLPYGGLDLLARVAGADPVILPSLPADCLITMGKMRLAGLVHTPTDQFDDPVRLTDLGRRIAVLWAIVEKPTIPTFVIKLSRR